MKAKRLIQLTTLVMTVIMFSTACGSVPANKVFSADDVSGKTIGVQLGTTGDIYATDEKTNNKKTQIERFNKGADAVSALKQGKVDCVIIDAQPAKAFVAKNKDLQVLSDPFVEEDYAISMKKGNTELKDKINKALAELKKDGTMQSIMDNYIGDDTKGKTPYTSPKDVDRSNGTLTMATNAAFEPYEYYDGNKVVGIDVDMAQAICDKLGMELKVQDMEFDSIITAVQSGKVDVGIAGMTVTKDRLKNVEFSDSYTTSSQVIITRKK